MESRGPLAASPGLLLLLLPPLPPHGHQRIQDPPAVHLSGGSGREPITIMTFDFTKIRKRRWRQAPGASDSASLRPVRRVEGTVLGDSPLLSVDGEEVLCLRQVSGPLAGKVQPVVRIAPGGLPHPHIFPSLHRLQLVPTLDGCLRRENWLDQQAQTSVSALTSSLRSCAAESQPGTFFPPGTRAEFSLQADPNGVLRSVNIALTWQSPQEEAPLWLDPEVEEGGRIQERQGEHLLLRPLAHDYPRLAQLRLKRGSRDQRQIQLPGTTLDQVEEGDGGRVRAEWREREPRRETELEREADLCGEGAPGRPLETKIRRQTGPNVRGIEKEPETKKNRRHQPGR
ncbi:sex hormone-binding globulin [Puma concolor]|uniref:Sex hormone-binding globulin n=1 Tax=Puma concolor TaxID=9696 RepID=A0A6P6HJY3_PUMCO|nr:sex hormone-binding globulin [Puma concolor]